MELQLIFFTLPFILFFPPGKVKQKKNKNQKTRKGNTLYNEVRMLMVAHRVWSVNPSLLLSPLSLTPSRLHPIGNTRGGPWPISLHKLRMSFTLFATTSPGDVPLAPKRALSGTGYSVITMPFSAIIPVIKQKEIYG